MSLDAKTRLVANGRRPPFKPGTRLNNIYEIDSLIAVGGMGEVYRGHTVQTGDPVALKILRPEFANNEAALGLFRKEASTLHHFAHDAIVRYYVFSFDDQINQAYLATEFVDGPSLLEALQRKPMAVEDVDILRVRLATALQGAHEFGVVHRDLSPDNVILPNNDVRRAKIIDFGIVRSLNPTEQTLIGSGFAGKYNYVSPEQLGLYGGDVGPQSDIYSLGLLLACALRGIPLEMEGSHVETVERRRTVPDLASVNARFRPLLHAMLQPDPARRIRSMREVADWKLPPRQPRRKKLAARLAMVAGIGDLAAALGAGVAVVIASRDSDSLLSRLPTGETRDPLTAASTAREVQSYSDALATPPPSVTVPDEAATAEAAQAADDSLTEPAIDNVLLDDPATLPVFDVTAPRVSLRVDRAVPPGSLRIDPILEYVERANEQPCFYAGIDQMTETSLTVHLYGEDTAAFEVFAEDIADRFNIDPEAYGHVISPDQCAAIDFASEGSSTSPIAISIKNDRLRAGDTLSANILNAEGRRTQSLLVDSKGRVYPLSEFADGADGASFSLRIDGPAPPSETPSLIISISQPASDSPFSLPVSHSGGAGYFTALKRTLAEAGSPVAVKLGYFVLLR